MLSNNAEFKNLLLLHSRDRRSKSLENELQNLPKAIAALDHSIDAEKESIAIATNELKTLETCNKTLDGEIASLGEQIVRQKTSNLKLRKTRSIKHLKMRSRTSFRR